ncbi:adenylate/guanylate cyclase domain-containing protein [Mesorhizobium sp. NZP2298]|uniref:adenylate/guanylate cyclase domain-containing protein n=1 Tax=Mesorhizobium sp. NZP2298 TaxID=2483403 RepID=UPI001554DF91|nr:adenylate/guanylate cyclase domain-containing protein [Mesorhizobium sp. NZP2298]QKC97125.1 adenylate/guanylate cyclase domain-containing protein [Mesorhizobium sp. NZP2298]
MSSANGQNFHLDILKERKNETGQTRAASFDEPATELTFLLTDIEGSTKLVESLGSRYADLLNRHIEILREATAAEGGCVIDFHADSFFAIFDRAAAAIGAAVNAQCLLYEEPWQNGIQLRVRMGLHTGTANLNLNSQIGYTGFDIHRTARICEAGHGGQILLSAATVKGNTEKLPPRAHLRELGTHSLKDIRAPEAIWEVVVDGLQNHFPPIRSLDNRPNNLPSILTPFVGRTKDKAMVRSLLIDKKVRLLTLTGAGGTGKTRLSIEVASGLLDEFPDGIFFVQLSTVSTAQLVLPEIAQVLGIYQFPGQSAFETVRHALNARRVLLILDNFEHVQPAASIALDLLRGCAQLKILVTSRESLDIFLEHEYQLSPLAVPSEVTAKDSFALFDSVQLFADLVRRVRPDFVLTTESATTIGEICRRLDGLPLAIELAASRLRLLEPSTLLKHLNNNFSALGWDSWSLGDRHRTLRNAIQWSYNLLDDIERDLFRKLSVFSSRFSLDQAVELCSTEIGGERAVDVLNSLYRKSLLQRDSFGEEPYFRMLETIREYGLEQLRETGREVHVRELHMSLMLSLAERWAPDLVRSKRQEILPQLLACLDDVRAAMEFGLQLGDTPTVSRFLEALLWLWLTRGQFTEGDTWIARALELTEGGDATIANAKVLEVAGWLRLMSGDWSKAQPFFQASRRIFEHVQMAAESTMSLMTEGITRAFATNDASGLVQVEVALEAFRDQRNLYGMGLTFTALGEAARLRREYASAKVFFDEALVCMRAIDNTYWTGVLLQNLAHVVLQLNEWKAAATLLVETLDLANEYEDPLMVTYYLAAMGHVALIRSRYQEAAKLFGATESSLKTLGVKFEPADQMVFENNLFVVRSFLEPAVFSLQFSEGAKWSRAEALAASLSLHDE